MKQILILGGTRFIGRNLIEALLKIDNFELTIFNRQQTKVHLFPEVNKIKGDRETRDINQIAGKKWDYVIDVSCYYPAMLVSALEQLNGNFEKYIFISTCSAYEQKVNTSPLKDELSPIRTCENDQYSDRTVSSYGNRKAECERILKHSGVPHFIFRPSITYGAYDHTDRFYYWLYQVRSNAQLLVPEGGIPLFSLTYVKDLINVIIQSLEMKADNETYNVISLPQVSIKQVIEACSRQLNVEPELINADADFLNEHGVAQWRDIPLWISSNAYTYSNQKLIHRFGFKPTALEIGVKESAAYYDTMNYPEPKYGMSDSRKSELLNAILQSKA